MDTLIDDALLDDAKRLLLAWRGQRGAIVAPMAYWWDGRNIWFSTAASAGKVAGLERDARCAMYVPGEEDGEGALLRGRARVFRPTDLVAMATHGATIAAAQAALAVKNYTSIAGYVADATRVPARWLPTNRVMVRVAVEASQQVAPPPLGPGIAPALPAGVPPEVRRLLSGQRRIVVGTLVDDGLGLLPAVWGAGFSLSLPAGLEPPDGTPLTAVLDHDPGFRPTDVAGVSVLGTYRGGALVADRVRWWRGFEGDVLDMSRGPVEGIVIPD